MVFSIFGKTKRVPPLTGACIKLANPENLIEFADSQTRNNATTILPGVMLAKHSLISRTPSVYPTPRSVG